MPDLPAPLRLASTFPFVGRGTELGTLRTLMPAAEGEGRRVVLLGGEAGSGKSRLVREFAREAADGGALVLYGACDAVVRTPYGPFVEALDQLARRLEPGELQAALGTGGGELARLLPELDAPAPSARADPDTERHRLHTSVTDLLTRATRKTPALFVLEDAHWADGATLLLLRHLTRAAGNARVLLLATFRDTEADMPPELSETLADLRRSDDVVRLRLGGLTDGEVAEFVRRSAGSGLEPELRHLAESISGLTKGNPFLVCELWRTFVETGDIGTPESVREVMSQRLGRLSPATADLLELAATAGPEFELDIVRVAAGLDESHLLPALDEAVRSGMLEEVPAAGLAYRFTHELVRRALYDRLSGVRRAELHLRVGDALETRSGRALADLAHHFARAAPFGRHERAVEYNVLAARAASESLAYDEAADRFRTALELGVEDVRARAEIFVELGEASHRGGKAGDALEAFRSVAQLARDLADRQLLARAAIGFEDACWRPGMTDQGAVELLEEAAAELGDEESSLRVRLLGGLARALDFQGDVERGAILGDNAIAMARRLGDRRALATVLMRSYWSLGARSLEHILDAITEARDIGEELGDNEIRIEAIAWRTPTFVALSDLASARREVAALLDSAEQTAQPFMVHVAEHYGSALALCDGRLAVAEASAIRSHEWSRLLTGRDPSGVYGIQMFSVRREQGRLAELAPVIRILAGESSREGPWRPGLAALLAELGMEHEARRELRRLVAEGLDQYRASLWMTSLMYLADASAAVGDEEAAALVYPALEPLAGQNMMIGHLVSCYGAADRYLGMLAATLGDAGAAVRHFEGALELNRRMGADTWTAHTAYEYGRFLLTQGRGERDRAESLLGEASALARRIGMPTLLARIGALGTRTRETALPDGLSPREAQILALIARGLSNREIGKTLTISEHTAANHIRSILRKTGCSNRTEAASYAHRHRLAEA